MLNLPNFLTLVRILTIPVFLVLLSSRSYGAALAVFVIGGVTDFLDGLSARWMGQETALGAHLDPLADKLLMISSFLMLALEGAIPPWLAVLVLSRDVFILTGYGMLCLLLDERPHVQPTAAGKCSTALQLLTVGVVLLLLYDPQSIDPLWRDIVVVATAVATVWSGLQYLYRGLVWLQNRASALRRPG
ncbi:MAG TPA: CDP-diacylglycerol--glycerol-3-phosphate 3-phosphatidyltransferase [candidate division Zixibacteria bacterium]|nr:CDP-diacylglycerol--glycerol-3-phosphate 3-phosphatidyltransferase [candidate division Zixibacteria bacterium]